MSVTSPTCWKILGMHLHWIQCLYTMFCHSRLIRFIQMSPAIFAPRLYGPHSAPVIPWLAVLCSILPAHRFTYVYDTSVVWPNRKKELQEFVLNGVHQNITFTVETEWSSIFHRCPGEQNNQTAQIAHSVYRKLHQGQTQPDTEIGCTSHCSPTRWYTVWPQSLVIENCTHAQVSQVQLRSEGLQHIRGVSGK